LWPGAGTAVAASQFSGPGDAQGNADYFPLTTVDFPAFSKTAPVYKSFNPVILQNLSYTEISDRVI
jgi:hypothetical protein